MFVLLRDLPPCARRYILTIIALGATAFVVLLPRATFAPVVPLIILILLSAFTSAFKVQLPIASGSNMSVSYVVDIASLILRGPHAAMLVSAASGWSQTTLNSKTPNPLYRTLFNMAILVLTVQCAGQVYWALGGTNHPELSPAILVPLFGLAFTYFFGNTIPIAIAIALTTHQSAWRIWKTDFVSNLPAYVIGAAAALVGVGVSESRGYLMTLLLTAAPLYLTYAMYTARKKSEASQGAILDAAHDAIITMDSRLNIREFNPAAVKMFGYARLDVLGRNVELLLPAGDRARHVSALNQYLARGTGPLKGQLELTAVKADGTEFPVELSVARVPIPAGRWWRVWRRRKGSEGGAVLTGFIRDITERRLLEEQLRQSQKLEAIGRLAGGVAHDFNNTLMSIMGAADLLLMQLGGDDAAREEANEIKQSIIRAAALTRQLEPPGVRRPGRNGAGGSGGE
jgi:PAS domain S-box-containing protein